MRASVTDSFKQHERNVNDTRSRVQNLLNSLEDGSITSKNIGRISEGHLLLMFRTVAYFGLHRWAPDVLSSDPESMYNLLHEYIALRTFEQVSSGYGYSHVGINMSFVSDFALLRKLYRSFVYSYLFNIAKSEAKNPGSVAKGKEMANVFKRRSDVRVYSSDA